MTLSELIPAVRRLPPIDKVKLIRILAEDLDTSENIFPLEPNKIYHLPTPYDSFGAAEMLMNAHKKRYKSITSCLRE